MARSTVVELTKLAPGTGEGVEIDFAHILTHPRTGNQTSEIVSVSEVRCEQRTSTNPVTWADITDQVSLTTPTIADGALPSSAVRFAVALDEDNEPPAGDGYQFIVRVVLANGQGEAGFAPVRVWPSAGVPSV